MESEEEYERGLIRTPITFNSDGTVKDGLG